MPRKPAKGLRVCVASGKGGTGKTLVATNLARAAGVWLADLDVEAPNCHLFLPCQQARVKGAFRPVPRIRQDLCNQCGICARECQFGALLALPDRVMVREEECHGCGACLELCPRGAIVMKQRKIGELVRCQGTGPGLVYGELAVGEPIAVPLIKATKAELPEGQDAILDCPPGTGCPAAESIRGSDLCLLVTEPTPFGRHDLELAMVLARKLAVPSAVVINKVGMGDADIESLCQENKVEVLGRLPFSRGIAETYSQGRLLVEEDEHMSFFKALWSRCRQVAGA